MTPVWWHIGNRRYTAPQSSLKAPMSKARSIPSALPANAGMSALQWHVGTHSSCTKTGMISSEPASSVAAAFETPTTVDTVEGTVVGTVGGNPQRIMPSVPKMHQQAQVAALHSCKVQTPSQAATRRSPTAALKAVHHSCSLTAAKAADTAVACNNFLTNALSPATLSAQHSCQKVPAGEDSRSVEHQAPTDVSEIVAAEDDAAVDAVLKHGVARMRCGSYKKQFAQVQ